MYACMRVCVYVCARCHDTYSYRSTRGYTTLSPSLSLAQHFRCVSSKDTSHTYVHAHMDACRHTVGTNLGSGHVCVALRVVHVVLLLDSALHKLEVHCEVAVFLFECTWSRLTERACVHAQAHTHTHARLTIFNNVVEAHNRRVHAFVCRSATHRVRHNTFSTNQCAFGVCSLSISCD